MYLNFFPWLYIILKHFEEYIKDKSNSGCDDFVYNEQNALKHVSFLPLTGMTARRSVG